LSKKVHAKRTGLSLLRDGNLECDGEVIFAPGILVGFRLLYLFFLRLFAFAFSILFVRLLWIRRYGFVVDVGNVENNTDSRTLSGNVEISKGYRV
jgi:hypothetical protein